MFVQFSIVLALVATTAHGHTMGWAKGMYCLGGNNTAIDDSNTNTAVNPLYALPQEKWWFQADRGCDKAPPKDGDVLTLPAGGTVTVEMAHNRAQTTLSYGGQYASDWPDGNTHDDSWSGPGSPPDCIQDDGAMHTNNQSMAAGTALAISYESDITAVTMENLVVFTTLEHTPWKRIATYQVPKGLPACPVGGCHCAFLWIPNGCGQPNMYMAGYKCQVTGANSTVPLALPAKPPVYCGDDATKCVKGAKQMMAWNQATGNNVSPPNGISPAYGTIMGYSLGAQNDIFSSGPVSTSTTTSSSISASSSTTSATSTKASSSTTVQALSSTTVSSSSTTSSTTSQISTTTSKAPQSSSSTFMSQATVTVTATMPPVTVTVTKTVRSRQATARV